MSENQDINKVNSQDNRQDDSYFSEEGQKILPELRGTRETDINISLQREQNGPQNSFSSIIHTISTDQMNSCLLIFPQQSDSPQNYNNTQKNNVFSSDGQLKQLDSNISQYLELRSDGQKQEKRKKKKIIGRSSKNISKKICRMWLKYFNAEKHMFDEQIYEELENFRHEKEKNIKSDKKNAHHGRKSLKQFFGQSGKVDPCKRSQQVRKMLHTVIRKYLQEYMIPEKQRISKSEKFKRRKDYMKYFTHLKVYSLRCKHKRLISRVECKNSKRFRAS